MPLYAESDYNGNLIDPETGEYLNEDFDDEDYDDREVTQSNIRYDSSDD